MMQYLLRDAAAAVAILNLVLLVVRRRSIGSVLGMLFIATFIWFILVRDLPSAGTSMVVLVVLGYTFASSLGIISGDARTRCQRRIVRFFFGQRGEDRWTAAQERMRDRERRAKERGVSVVTILEEDTAAERQRMHRE